jgi:uncharacterized protein
MSAEAPRSPPGFRPLYLIGGLLLTGLGIAGFLLPVLPGTIFLILAAACFARSSPRLEAWLVSHPRLGPGILAWRQTGAIPRSAKVIAVGSMALSFGIMWLAAPPMWARWVAGGILLACALFVASRPSGATGSK